MQNMDLQSAISKAQHARSDADKWINILNFLDFVICLILIPFTMGLSLIGMLTIPMFAALGAIATHSKRTAELTLIQTKLLADERR